MEHKVSLGIENYFVLQDDGGYKFSQDSVLLANLANIKRGARALDLGSGSGILSVLALLKKGAASCVGIEVDPAACDMARRSAEMNNLQDRLHFIEGDVKNIRALVDACSFDIVLCNPPYFEANKKLEADSARSVARMETTAALADFVGAAAYALKNRGEAWFSVKTTRLGTLIAAMSQRGLETKQIILVFPKFSLGADTAIVRAVKGGGAGLSIKTFVAMNEDGTYTAEYNAVYGGNAVYNA